MQKKTGLIIFCSLIILCAGVLNQINSIASVSHSNPMQNWAFNPAAGDYFNHLKSDIEQDPNNKTFTIKDFHFKKFPVKYRIMPMPAAYKVKIDEAVSEFSRYFAMKAAVGNESADITIQLADQSTVMQLLNTNRTTVLGMGGMKISREVTNNSIKDPIITSQIYILRKAFVKPVIKKVILHELGHAFGIKVHSKNPNDIMYPKDTTPLVNRLSSRDLNTLWLLHNEW